MDPDRKLSARNTVILLERLWRKSGDRLAAMSWSGGRGAVVEPVEGSWNLVRDAATPVAGAIPTTSTHLSARLCCGGSKKGV